MNTFHGLYEATCTFHIIVLTIELHVDGAGKYGHRSQALFARVPHLCCKGILCIVILLQS